MKHLFLIFLFYAAANLLQAQQITNVLATQDGDNVLITFDITEAKKGQSFGIEVKCSTDGGSTFSIFPASLSGDVKAVTAGTNKQIIWNVLQDRDEIVGENIVFELSATVKGGDFSGTNGIFTDERDGKIYKWVKIGNQTWMAENLAYKVNNGCWAYDDKKSNVAKYGYLYNFETANKVCPNAWHLPSDEEWTTLTDYLGGLEIAGGKLKATIDWKSPNTDATNISKFTALPGGYRDGSNGRFGGKGSNITWWSKSLYADYYPWNCSLHNNNAIADRGNSRQQDGFSVRCVRD